MATFKIISGNKVDLKCEFRNFMVPFVNGLRRVILSELPTVVVKDIQILENTSQMPHEMLKHRMELLPINVKHTDTQIIKDSVLELRLLPQPAVKVITTADFASNPNLIMKDRDLDTPLILMKVLEGEVVHIKAKLAVEPGSQVCLATYGYHIDRERAEYARNIFIESGKDVREFDNFYIQKEFSRDEMGRPNWIDFAIETVGVLSPREIMNLGVAEFKKQIDKWIEHALENVTREAEENVYHISSEFGGHTVGALIQETMYHSKQVSFVSYDIPHPMKSTMKVRFVTELKPENLIKSTQKNIHEYCELVEKGI